MSMITWPASIDEGVLLREQASMFAEAQGIQLDSINVSTDNVADRVDYQTGVIEDGYAGTHESLGHVASLLERILANENRRLDLETSRG